MDAATLIALALASSLYALALLMPRRSAARPRSSADLPGDTLPISFAGSRLAFAIYDQLQRTYAQPTEATPDDAAYRLALEGKRLNLARPYTDADLRALAAALADAARIPARPLHADTLAAALAGRGLPPVDHEVLEIAAGVINRFPTA